ncbi:hypothetical protein NOVO_00400 [Rickettsiales bacterium Ac37b]|nr:hypothetical protein NOVO_00400 [Rickettsiales bacterium Ac37b]
MSAPEQNNDGDQPIPTNSLSSLEASSNQIPIRTVESIMDQFLNEQLPHANSFIFNNLIGEIQIKGELPKENKFYSEYKNMVHHKAALMIKDVMKAILKTEKKWDNSYEDLNSKELYEKLNEKDQARFKELFTKTEDWTEQTSALFDPGNEKALQEQLYVKIKRELVKNAGSPVYYAFASQEIIDATHILSEELYKDISIPNSAGYVLLKNNDKKNKKDPKVLMISDNKVIQEFIQQALINTFNPEANIDFVREPGKMRDIIQKSPEKYKEFAGKVNNILAAYSVVNNAISNIDNKYGKKTSQENFYQILNSVMPEMIRSGINYLHINQSELSTELANDLIKNNSILAARNTLKLEPNALKRVTRRISNYGSNIGSKSKFYYSIDSGIDTASNLSDRSLSRSSSRDSMASSKSRISDDEQKIGTKNSKKVLPTLIQPFGASENILEYLMHKYDELAVKAENENVSPERKRQNLYTLNAELFELASSEAEIIPINKLSSAPEKVYIKDIENNPNVVYSNIGINDSANSLVMAETTDGKIYFDEKEKGSNKFTGVIFVERINAQTGELLGAKDVIYYKEGEVVKFIEGLEGASRLGQIEQFKQANQSPAHEHDNRMKSPEQIVGDVVKEVFSKTKEKLSENDITKLTRNLLKTQIDYSDKKALSNQISNAYDVVEKSLYNIETTRGKRISPIIMQNSLEQLLPVFTKMEPQYLAESSEKIVTELTQQLYQNRSLFSTAIGSGFKINKNGLEKVAQNIASSYESESKLFDQNNNLVNTANSAEQDSRGKQEYKQFKVSTGMQLSEKEQQYVLDSLGRDSGLVADKQKELFDNTLKSIKTHDLRALQEAVNKSFRESAEKGKNNTQVPEIRAAEVEKQAMPLEKPVINLPPKLPEVPSLSEQKTKNTFATIKGKRYMAPMNNPNALQEQPSIKPQIAEPKQQNVSDAPTFSTFKPNTEQPSRDIDYGRNLSDLAKSAANEERAEKLEERAEYAQEQQEYIRTQNVSSAPASLVRNNTFGKDEYALSDMKPFADEIMNKVIIQAKISDKNKVEELKDFLRKELNQYVDNKEKDNISKIMDMMYLPEMVGRKENFQQFIANALVSINRQNKILSEDMLVDKMELFHSNLTKDHIGKQQFNASSSKRLSDKEMQYVLDNLNNKILADNVIQIIRDHSNYNIFAQEVEKLMQDHNIDHKKYNNTILSAKELKHINLNDPNQLDLLKNTVDVINSYDLKGLKKAIKMAVVGKQVKEINRDIDPSTVPPHPNSQHKHEQSRE